MRLWWNGIHNGLKIRRGNLAGSNPANRTKNESPLAGDSFLVCSNQRGFDRAPAKRHSASFCSEAALRQGGMRRAERKHDSPISTAAKKSRQSHHVAANVESFAATFLFRENVTAHPLRCGSSPQKVTLGSPVRLQARSQRLVVATNLLRANPLSTLAPKMNRPLRAILFWPKIKEICAATKCFSAKNEKHCNNFAG